MMSTSSDRSKNRRFPFSFLWSITSSSFSLFVGRIGNGWFGWKAIFPKAGWISLFFTSKYQLHSYSTLISYYEKEKKNKLFFFFFCPVLHSLLSWIIVQVTDWISGVITTGKRLIDFCGRKQRVVSGKRWSLKNVGEAGSHGY